MATLDAVESRIFRLPGFALELGGRLDPAEICHETYGTLNASGDNAVLIVHGYTSSGHAAGRYAPGKAARGVAADAAGWFDALIGPGKPIDTDRLFVVSSNALGSAHGSSGPNATNPATGKPYGPDFPDLTIADIVRAQKALLDSLGVKRLLAVAGPSMGGFQAFQWAVSYPDFMDGVVATVTAPKMMRGIDAARELRERLARDPGWNGGRYHDGPGIAATLAAIRFETLKQYGQDAILAETMPDPAAREAAMRAAAAQWAQVYDGLSLVVLREAIGRFDVTGAYDRIRAKLLYVLSPTDVLFPTSIGPGHVADMRRAGVDVTYVELASDKGHMASHADAPQWAEILRAFLRRLRR